MIKFLNVFFVVMFTYAWGHIRNLKVKKKMGCFQVLFVTYCCQIYFVNFIIMCYNWNTKFRATSLSKSWLNNTNSDLVEVSKTANFNRFFTCLPHAWKTIETEGNTESSSIIHMWYPIYRADGWQLSWIT